MNLFLCSHFSQVGNLIKEEIENKKVVFIPTASINEGYTGYVGSARKLFKKMGANLTEIDISKEDFKTIEAVFEETDIIYFTGVDKLLKKELKKGKLMIGESAGSVICAPSISYIEIMDEKPEDYSQIDDNGLNLIDFYVLPHYLTSPFKKITATILKKFSDLKICPINNHQAIMVNGKESKIIEK